MPKNSQKVGEANFKAAVFQEYFGTKKFAFMQEIDHIDFIITDNTDRHLIWAETKKNTADTVEMFVQLILTIGKAWTFDRYNPPPFLCVFDYKKIAFLQYNAIHDIFYQNDFNWNITPSDHKSKEFQQIKEIVEKTVEDKKMSFISFTIWDLSHGPFPKEIIVDIPETTGQKKYFVDNNKSINHWICSFENTNTDCIGFLICETSDFQKVHQPYLTLESSKRESRQFFCNEKSLISACIYFSVRLCIEPSWLNDRDQFLFPSNDGYKKDIIFHNNCLIFTLFHGQNRRSSKNGKNHWIPFTAEEVGAKNNFNSDFMSGFLKDKKLSKEAKNTFNADKELWKYYHAKIEGHQNAPIDASLYDIREFFQGRSESGTMKQKSSDEKYNALIKALRQNQSILAEKIKTKAYEYRFLVE